MIESVKGDMAPGTSVPMLLSSDAAVDTVAGAFGDPAAPAGGTEPGQP
jgi:hypothetical protein